MPLFVVKNEEGVKGLYLEDASFKKGEVVHTLSGPVLSEPTQTSIKVADYNHIEDPVGKFINHSCHPTTKIDGFEVIALKKLSRGDQITFNYLENEDELAVPFFCSCCGKLIA